MENKKDVSIVKRETSTWRIPGGWTASSGLKNIPGMNIILVTGLLPRLFILCF